jgi:hypothetical protein
VAASALPAARGRASGFVAASGAVDLANAAGFRTAGARGDAEIATSGAVAIFGRLDVLGAAAFADVVARGAVVATGAGVASTTTECGDAVTTTGPGAAGNVASRLTLGGSGGSGELGPDVSVILSTPYKSTRKPPRKAPKPMTNERGPR